MEPRRSEIKNRLSSTTIRLPGGLYDEYGFVGPGD